MNLIIKSGSLAISPNQLTVLPIIENNLIGIKYGLKKLALSSSSENFQNFLIKIIIDDKIQNWDLKGIGFWANRGIFDIVFIEPLIFEKNLKIEVKNNSEMEVFTMNYYFELYEF